ncbi:related to Mitochondrial pyruvate carrier 2 [Hanseniaspora guilliermondii]|uniref:Mitochondrial pyruvate carrier n=1 Tax=Hanseniaspora guilliermondii TaxID=56406 RepID=A0A1L0AWQ8_9ASCO|nr:related to Mitochondrial pyruvate carrier 2 [Hanseniaspora guilliermondii]
MFKQFFRNSSYSFKRSYSSTASSASGSKFQAFLNSETGPKTIHFWAPTLKWGLVFAGISDVNRPIESVSGTQSLSLIATAMIWTRWSFVIKPKNMLLASVNFFLGLTSGYQILRLINWRYNTLNESAADTLKYIIKGPQEDNVEEVKSGNVHHPQLDNDTDNIIFQKRK